MNLYSPSKSSSVDWMKASLAANNQRPLTWYKVSNQWIKHLSTTKSRILFTLLPMQANFDTPNGNEPLALDLGSMGKGQAWINGQSIGRYWTAYAKGQCNSCSYGGTYRQPKCQYGCGKPTQRWYMMS